MKTPQTQPRAVRRRLLFGIWGVAAGATESMFTAPYLCVFTMLPLFTVLKVGSRRELIVKLLPFLSMYDLTKVLFLVEIYDLISDSVLLGLSAALLAVVSVAAVLFLAQAVCLSFYCELAQTGRVSKHGICGAVIISLLFSASEWLCANLSVLSFPWLGVWAQADGSDAVLMSANLLGCRFTSFLILLANGLVYLCVSALKRKNKLEAVRFMAELAALCGVCLLYGYGSIRRLRLESEESGSVSVMAAQLDCEGEEKSNVSAVKSSEEYMELIKENYGGETLIFLPETAVNTVYEEGKQAFYDIESFCRENSCAVLTGCFFTESDKKYNSIVAITPGDAYAVHYKSHLIPFGEYVPFSFIWDDDPLYGYHGEYEPAGIGLSGASENIEIACCICIESIYPEVLRSQVKRGGELIFIATNDSWFGDSSARSAHYLQSKMRAIENSRFAVRAGNCGISAVIAPWGEERALELSKEKSVLSSDASLMTVSSVYTEVGDVFMLPAFLTAAASAAKSLLKVRKISKKRKPNRNG